MRTLINFQLLILLLFFKVIDSGNVHDCVKASRRVRRRSFYPPYWEDNPDVEDLEPNVMEGKRPDPSSFPKNSRNESTIAPCMVCEPVKEECPDGCGGLLAYYVESCSGVCLPDSYFFDPEKTMSGCFDDHTYEIYRNIWRCGCNAASSTMYYSKYISVIAITILSSLFMF